MNYRQIIRSQYRNTGDVDTPSSCPDTLWNDPPTRTSSGTWLIMRSSTPISIAMTEQDFQAVGNTARRRIVTTG
jgi:hypothetical protein